MKPRNLFLIGQTADSRALLSDVLFDEYPDVRAWHFRCVVDAGGALLRCRPSAIPDAILLVDGHDPWTENCLAECINTRRELAAVGVFALLDPVSAAEPSVAQRTHAPWIGEIATGAGRDSWTRAVRSVLATCAPHTQAARRPPKGARPAWLRSADIAADDLGYLIG